MACGRACYQDICMYVCIASQLPILVGEDRRRSEMGRRGINWLADWLAASLAAHPPTPRSRQGPVQRFEAGYLMFLRRSVWPAVPDEGEQLLAWHQTRSLDNAQLHIHKHH